MLIYGDLMLNEWCFYEKRWDVGLVGECLTPVYMYNLFITMMNLVSFKTDEFCIKNDESRI